MFQKNYERLIIEHGNFTIKTSDRGEVGELLLNRFPNYVMRCHIDYLIIKGSCKKYVTPKNGKVIPPNRMKMVQLTWQNSSFSDPLSLPQVTNFLHDPQCHFDDVNKRFFYKKLVYNF